jgi:hypothetical protein
LGGREKERETVKEEEVNEEEEWGEGRNEGRKEGKKTFGLYESSHQESSHTEQVAIAMGIGLTAGAVKEWKVSKERI